MLHTHSVIFVDSNLLQTKILKTYIYKGALLRVLNHFVYVKWVSKLINTFHCSFFLVKDNTVKNICPVACLIVNNTTYRYKNTFSLLPPNNNERTMFIVENL